MRGLWIKDLGILKKEKQFFGMVFVMAALFLGIQTDFSFVVSYITLMFAIIAAGTIGYDEFENGMGYLFTLPVSRKSYVGEKYLFSMGITLPALAGISVLSYVASMLRGIELSLEECAFTAGSAFLLMTVLVSVTLPLQLKFGSEKSRAAVVMLGGITVLAAYAGVKACEAWGIDWMGMLDRILTAKPAVVLMAAACGGILAVSYLISLRIMEKKEF